MAWLKLRRQPFGGGSQCGAFSSGAVGRVAVRGSSQRADLPVSQGGGALEKDLPKFGGDCYHGLPGSLAIVFECI